MMKNSTVGLLAFTAFTVIGSGCGSSDTVSNVQPLDSVDAMASIEALGHGTDAQPTQALASKDGMDRFEALKKAKPSDGSIARAIPQRDFDQDEDIDLDELTTSPGWELSLEPIKDRFNLGEPVVIRASISNVGDEAMKVVDLLKPEFQYTTYLVTDPDGLEYTVRPQGIFCVLPLTNTDTFQPGQSATEEVKLWIHRGGMIFDKAGEYSVRAIYNGAYAESALMKSKRVRFQVMYTYEDNLAPRLLMSGEAAQLIEWEKGDHLTEGIETLERVIADYPDSFQATYAHYVLGTAKAQSFFNGREERAPQPAQAIAHLDHVRNALRDGKLGTMSATFRFNTYQYLASSHQALGQQDEARSLLKEFVAQYAGKKGMTDTVVKAREMMSQL